MKSTNEQKFYCYKELRKYQKYQLRKLKEKHKKARRLYKDLQKALGYHIDIYKFLYNNSTNHEAVDKISVMLGKELNKIEERLK